MDLADAAALGRLEASLGATPQALDATGQGGWTPLHLAASRGDLEAITLLVEAGARPEAMEDGRTPADLARERGHPEAAAHLP